MDVTATISLHVEHNHLVPDEAADCDASAGALAVSADGDGIGAGTGLSRGSPVSPTEA